MKVLTDEEITAVACSGDYSGVMQFARAIEAAVIKRLAAGVSVELEIKENKDGND